MRRDYKIVTITKNNSSSDELNMIERHIRNASLLTSHHVDSKNVSVTTVRDCYQDLLYKIVVDGNKTTITRVNKLGIVVRRVREIKCVLFKIIIEEQGWDL